MDSGLERSQLRRDLARRPPPPPRPSFPDHQSTDDLRSSDSDSRSFSVEPAIKIDQPRAKVVVLGGGFAGASLAVALQKLSRVDLILIDGKVRLILSSIQPNSFLASLLFSNAKFGQFPRIGSSTHPHSSSSSRLLSASIPSLCTTTMS